MRRKFSRTETELFNELLEDFKMNPIKNVPGVNEGEIDYWINPNGIIFHKDLKRSDDQITYNLAISYYDMKGRGDGYFEIKLNGKLYFVHRLVAATYLDMPYYSKMDVHHIDLDNTNNNVSNLLVLSHSDHMKLHHKIRRENKKQFNNNKED